MDVLYPWIKAFHIISVISWMAGLLYLPRLFVYHADCAPESEQAQTFVIMEGRLYKAIMTPSMAASWVFGLILVFVFDAVDWETDRWFYVKFLFVVGLSAFHEFLGKLRQQFSENNNRHDPRFYRLINEIPTALMVGIVILVIVRPF